MIKRIAGTFVLLILMTTGLTLSAQDDQGTLSLEITEINSDNPQVAAQMEMMKGSAMNVSYKDGQSVTNMNMMGGMVEVNTKISGEGDMDMLMSMMGQKIWVQATKAEMEIAQAESENAMTDLDISYDESDTKEILGFNCYKMIVTSPDNDQFELNAYITEDIKINAAVIQNVDISEFKGFPLEYIVDAGIVQMTFSATNYSEDVDDSVFDLNTNGYTKMTWQEFMDSMGAMGGGFGF